MKSIESNQVKLTLVMIAIIFFYFGDIITTWLILSHSGTELNKFLATIGFTGYLIFKTIVIMLFCIGIYYLDRIKFYTTSGTLIGMMLMAGILATICNLGAFR